MGEPTPAPAPRSDEHWSNSNANDSRAGEHPGSLLFSEPG